jgi:hypothetical protein
MIVCERCNRFVRETTCPFCGARVDQPEKSARPRGHATRSVLAFGTAAATAVGFTLAACSDTMTTPDVQHPTDAGDARYDFDASVYGAHPSDAADERYSSDAGAYGQQPFDATADAGANDGSADANDDASNDATDQ